MAVLIIVLKTIVAVLSVLLSLLILLHKGKGGGLSDMFGGGLTANAGTSGVAEKNLNRWTVGIAILWVLLIVSISLIAKTIWRNRRPHANCHHLPIYGLHPWLLHRSPMPSSITLRF